MTIFMSYWKPVWKEWREGSRIKQRNAQRDNIQYHVLKAGEKTHKTVISELEKQIFAIFECTNFRRKKWHIASNLGGKAYRRTSHFILFLLCPSFLSQEILVGKSRPGTWAFAFKVKSLHLLTTHLQSGHWNTKKAQLPTLFCVRSYSKTMSSYNKINSPSFSFLSSYSLLSKRHPHNLLQHRKSVLCGPDPSKLM